VSKNVRFVFVLIQVVVVPLTAFLIRMYRGDTHTPEEAIISAALTMTLARLSAWLKKESQ
jgi:hypothetical protein